MSEGVAHSEEVGVGVDEAGHDGLPGRIDDLRAIRDSGIPSASDGCYPVALNNNCDIIEGGSTGAVYQAPAKNNLRSDCLSPFLPPY